MSDIMTVCKGTNGQGTKCMIGCINTNQHILPLKENVQIEFSALKMELRAWQLLLDMFHMLFVTPGASLCSVY